MRHGKISNCISDNIPPQMKILNTLSAKYMSCVIRKAVFWVSDQVLQKPCCAAKEDGWKLENFGLRKKRKYTINVAKTKALISCAVNVQLICVFVFAYAKSKFSHDAAYIAYRA